MCDIDSNGKIFFDLCIRAKRVKCLDMLKSLDQVDLEYVCNKENALMWACCNHMTDVCVGIMSHSTTNYEILNTNSRGNTILMIALHTNQNIICTEILNRLRSLPDKIIYNYLSHTNNEGFTSLSLACKMNMENVCMKILQNPHYCALNKTGRNGYTALMYACDNRLETVCMKILKTPDDCGLECHNHYKFTALTFAKYNCMPKVRREILKYLNNSTKISLNTHDIFTKN